MSYEKKEIYEEKTTAEIAVHVKEILRLLGEDPDREGLVKTPERVAKALQFLTQGYSQDGGKIIQSAIFDEEYRQMVLVKDIELYSTCEHHMMPFLGKCHVAYIPNGKITGLSKIARVVETFARRLQVQERLTVRSGTASTTLCILLGWLWSSRRCTHACPSAACRRRMPSPPHRRSPESSSARRGQGTNS